ncbi:ATP-dependent DNA helicase RecG [Candidatus Hoaglandella endobia]|uniref:ATP-dependent DNA helicase RecG n=1 Tax=Candidatus Hoaglandella endobia TaxID=1778263 RepID=A0A143WU93_9ENTR|nr:ATP-dependent DNA helicase RecG [Candidatus Hoaglandella endobia]CUX97429.1 ATP-dependent DNA helicase RecG [Candidatus Hoaglandella endobia]
MKGRLLNSIPLNTLSGVGPSIVSKFARIGLKNLQDLLFYLPIRYEDRTKLYPIDEALPGMTVTIQGKVLNSEISFSRKRMLTCRLCDDSGILTLRFFNFNAAMKKNFANGKLVTVYGEIRHGKQGSEIIHPEYHIINESSQSNNKLAASLTPVYPTTDGLRQATLRNTIDQALKLVDMLVPELLPQECRYKIMSLSDALRLLHRPPPEITLDNLVLGYHPAQRRLIFEELLAYNLSMLAVRAGRKKDRALPLQADSDLTKRFIAALPFAPTRAQSRVVEEINQDLAREVPMMRLVQGDVGAGKTLVAALAALCAISEGKQVALMAPTELLAEQHAHNFRNWFAPLGIEVGWLAGKQKRKARQAQQEAIANGLVALVVGTHAIFQAQVHFAGLALVIIDEQHRFGVHQRLAFWKKGFTQGFYPHQLIMTATPIPRTLAMTTYANLDTSVIDEILPGRTPVTTVVIPNTRREEVIQRVRQACLKEQRQAYWVCTLIEESELLEVQAAEHTWKKLVHALPELQIGLVHGRLKEEDKQQLMQTFKAGKVHLLVATTVIEVGIDVPNASLIIIENPERLGLAQLHQLRGRVGRGAVSSHCVLLYQSPLSKIAYLRLKVLRDSNDGFIIAQQDLELRGPGELLGTRQTGNFEFKVADLSRDHEMIPEVQRLSRHIHQHYPALEQALIERWRPKNMRYTFI